MKSIIGLAVTCSLLASAALADTKAPEKDAEQFAGHESKAWSLVHEGMLNHMSPHAASHVQYIVYHTVAKELCDGVELDMEKIKAAKIKVHPENWDDLSEKDRTEWTYKYLVSYGAIFGLMLAEHADHKEDFCKGVHEIIADKEHSKDTYFALKAN